MADKDKARNYMMQKYQETMKFCHEYLGGKCAVCSSTENLDIDHIDKTTKSFTIAQGWSTTREKLIEELNKCQLLCKSCHNIKTVVQDKGQILTKNQDVHGTLTSHRYCKCDLCKKSHSDYMIEWRKKNKLKKLGI